MKLRLLFFTLFTAACLTISAQDKEAYAGTRAQSVFGELGGNGLLFSVNYDTRFSRSDKGLGMRAGLGFFGGSGGGILTVPIVLNHLAGRAPHYFESGLGFTYATFTGEDEDFFGGGGNLLIPSIGYRYQAIGKGFIGRVVLSPVVNLGEGGGWFLFGGVSAGFKF